MLFTVDSPLLEMLGKRKSIFAFFVSCALPYNVGVHQSNKHTKPLPPFSLISRPKKILMNLVHLLILITNRDFLYLSNVVAGPGAILKVLFPLYTFARYSTRPSIHKKIYYIFSLFVCDNAAFHT